MVSSNCFDLYSSSNEVKEAFITDVFKRENYISEEYIKCFRIENNEDVLEKKCLYKQYPISLRKVFYMVSKNKAIGQLVRGRNGKCDEGWSLFTIEPKVLFKSFDKNRLDISYEKLKGEESKILSIKVKNPITKKRSLYGFIEDPIIREMFYYFRMPVTLRIGTEWLGFDEAVNIYKDKLDEDIVEEFIVCLCTPRYFSAWYNCRKFYYSNLEYNDVCIKRKYRANGQHVGYTYQYGVSKKQKLIIHYGASQIEDSEIIDLGKFKKNIE